MPFWMRRKRMIEALAALAPRGPSRAVGALRLNPHLSPMNVLGSGLHFRLIYAS